MPCISSGMCPCMWLQSVGWWVIVQTAVIIAGIVGVLDASSVVHM